MPETHESEKEAGGGGKPLTKTKIEVMNPIRAGSLEFVALRAELGLTSHEYSSSAKSYPEFGKWFELLTDEQRAKMEENMRNMKRRPRLSGSSVSIDGGVFEEGAGI